MAEVKVAFKNVLDKRASYKKVEGNMVSGVLWAYAREYCEDLETYNKVVKEKITVKLNGKPLSVDDWTTTPVIDGDKLLIAPMLEGDNMGAILGIIIGAIIIIFAPYLAPLLGVLAPTLFLMGAVMIVSGLLGILMAPDLPTFSAFSSKGSSQTYSWSGIKTQARPDQPVPVVYGKHIVGGNLISIFTEREGAEDFLYMLVALCEGEIAGICTEDNTDAVCTTTDFASGAYKHPFITFNDQPLQNFTNLEWWYRTGTNLPNAGIGLKNPLAQNQIPHFNGSRIQMDDGRQITQDGIVYTTTKDVDMVTIQTRFPSMFDATGSDIVKTGIHYGIQYKVNGTSTWYSVTLNQWTPSVTALPNGGVTTLAWYLTATSYTAGTEGIMRDNTKVLSEIKPDGFHIRICGEGATTDDMVDPYTGGVIRKSTKILQADLIIRNLRTNQISTQKLIFQQITSWTGFGEFTSTAQSAQMTIGNYNVRFQNGVRVGDSWTLQSAKSANIFWIPIEAKTKTGLWDSRTLDFSTLAGAAGKETYDLRVARQEPISSDFKVSNDALLRSVIEIVNGDFIYPNTALVGFKIKASGQLSGSPPNVNVMVKGTKVEVPDHSGSERFEQIYWDSDQSRWEYDGGARTWDETTYTTEYSNNAMLCLRDLMLNKRYGLGEYIVGADLSSANVVSIIKESHKIYTPTEGNYLSWWDAGYTQEFVKHIGDPWGGIYPKTTTINAAGQSISYSDAYTHFIPLVLDAPLKAGQKYQLSIALSGTTKNVDIDVGVRRLAWGARYRGYWYQIGTYVAADIEDKGDGVHTLDFTAKIEGINRIILIISKNGGAANCNGTVDDISLSKIQGTGTSWGWRYHTYNGVLDAPQSALSTLMEFTNAFRVWPSWFEGTFKFIMDKDEVPIHTLSISNTSSFSQTWVPLSEIPYKIVGQFTDEDQNYGMNQIMVQSTDNTISKSNQMTVGLKGITNRKRAEREIKFRLAKFANSTHSINIKCGMDMIHATAGDIVNVSNDLPSWGHGTRVASWNAGNKYLYLVDPYVVEATSGADIMAKYMDTNNNFQTATVVSAGLAPTDVVRRLTLVTWPGTPAKDGVAAIGKSTSYVKKFRLLSVTRTAEDEVEVNALEHIDTLYGSEPVLKVTQDHETSALDEAIGVPDPPINVSVVPLAANEGIGFEIYAEHANLRSQEIQVGFSEVDADSTFVQVGTIGKRQTTVKYINNKLAMERTYRFKLTSVGVTGTSPDVYIDVYLPKIIYKVDPPTGLQIKGADPLVQTWDGLDVTIIWNPVGQNLTQSGMMDHYTIYVYNDVYDPDDVNTNLLRTAYPKKSEYTYTYDMNLEDNGTTTPENTLIFVLTANLINGVESNRSRPFKVLNSPPARPSNLDSTKWMRTVNFTWAPDNSTDFKFWKIRNRLEGAAATPIGVYGAWEERRDNFYPRTVSGTEINTYGEETRIFFQIKAFDLYNASSGVASINRTTQTLNIKTVDIATGAVGSTAITASAVTTSKLSTFAVETDKLAANAVTAGKILVASLSAISADLGIVTAGLAKSTDGRLQVDFTNKWIKVFDTSATLRVHLGFIP